MIHYKEDGRYFVLLGVGFNLIAYSLSDLIKQAKDIYDVDILTILN